MFSGSFVNTPLIYISITLWTPAQVNPDDILSYIIETWINIDELVYRVNL